jgi:hypothetical protein
MVYSMTVLPSVASGFIGSRETVVSKAVEFANLTSLVFFTTKKSGPEMNFPLSLEPETRSEGRPLTDDRLLVGSLRFLSALGRDRPSTTHDDRWDTEYSTGKRIG